MDLINERILSALRQYRAMSERVEGWTPADTTPLESLQAGLNMLALEVASELDCAFDEAGIEP